MARRVIEILRVEENVPILLWTWTRQGAKSSKQFSVFIKKCKICITNSWYDILEFKDPFTGKKAKIKKKKYGGYDRLDLSKPETGFGIRGFEGFTNKKKRAKVIKNDKPRPESTIILGDMRIGAAIGNVNGIARVNFADDQDQGIAYGRYLPTAPIPPPLVAYRCEPPRPYNKLKHVITTNSIKDIQNEINDGFIRRVNQIVNPETEIQAQLGQKHQGGNANANALINHISEELKELTKNYIGQSGPSHVTIQTAITLPQPIETVTMDINLET